MELAGRYDRIKLRQRAGSGRRGGELTWAYAKAPKGHTEFAARRG